MPLSFTDKSLQTINSTDYKAIGSHGELIIVEASHEAIQVYGEVTVQARASAKYDANQMANNKVTVRTADFV